MTSNGHPTGGGGDHREGPGTGSVHSPMRETTQRLAACGSARDEARRAKRTRNRTEPSSRRRLHYLRFHSVPGFSFQQAHGHRRTAELTHSRGSLANKCTRLHQTRSDKTEAPAAVACSELVRHSHFRARFLPAPISKQSWHLSPPRLLCDLCKWMNTLLGRPLSAPIH